MASFATVMLKTAVRIALTGKAVDKKLGKARLKVCAGDDKNPPCPYFDATRFGCKACGCFALYREKLVLPDAKCGETLINGNDRWPKRHVELDPNDSNKTIIVYKTKDGRIINDED